MKGKSILALIAAILGVGYIIFSFSYWAEASSENVGGAIAATIVFPHLIATGIGAIFNVLGFFLNNRAFILVAGILYSVAMVLFPMYFMFVIIQAILCYIAFALMGKKTV